MMNLKKTRIWTEKKSRIKYLCFTYAGSDFQLFKHIISGTLVQYLHKSRILALRHSYTVRYDYQQYR
jgi:hypothetical protein